MPEECVRYSDRTQVSVIYASAGMPVSATLPVRLYHMPVSATLPVRLYQTYAPAASRLRFDIISLARYARLALT